MLRLAFLLALLPLTAHAADLGNLPHANCYLPDNGSGFARHCPEYYQEMAAALEADPVPGAAGTNVRDYLAAHKGAKPQ